MQATITGEKPGIAFELTATERFVNDILSQNWIISVQYSNTLSRPTSSWENWGSAFCRPQTPDMVIDSIQECHRRNPDYSIRINAKKLDTPARFTYWVYHKEENKGNFDENSRFEAYKEAAIRTLTQDNE